MADQLAGKTVLLVEDDYLIAADLARALTERGARVVGPVPDLASGLSLASDEPAIDLAVLDVKLQGDRSYAVADKLAERSVSYLFLTGYDGWSLPGRYRDRPRLAKPCPPPLVIDALAKLAADAA